MSQRKLFSPNFGKLQLRTLNSKFSLVGAFWKLRRFLVRNDMRPFESFRTTGELAILYLCEDMRKNGRLSCAHLACLFNLDRHIPPNDQQFSEKIYASPSFTPPVLYKATHPIVLH